MSHGYSYIQQIVLECLNPCCPRNNRIKCDLCYCCYSVAQLCPSLCDPKNKHSRLPCPLLSPGVCSSSCPLSWWCYLTISSPALFFCLQSFPASGSFLSSQLFTSQLFTGWPKYSSFSIRPFSEYWGLISFKIDWFYLYPWVIMVLEISFPGNISKMVFTYGLSLA